MRLSKRPAHSVHSFQARFTIWPGVRRQVVAPVRQTRDQPVVGERARRREVRVGEVRRVVAVHAGDLPDVADVARRARATVIASATSLSKNSIWPNFARSSSWSAVVERVARRAALERLERLDLLPLRRRVKSSSRAVVQRAMTRNRAREPKRCLLRRILFLRTLCCVARCIDQNDSTSELVKTSLSNSVMPPYSSLCRYSALTTMCELTTTRTPAVHAISLVT